MSINQYGRFIEDEGCFELVNEPPRKWRNFHYNDIGEHEMVVEVSNIGDGQSFVRDRDGNTCNLLKWDSKYLYIRDDETNHVFCPWGQPAPRAVQNRTCRYYPAKTVVSSECDELKVTHTTFVPRTLTAEVWSVDLENRSDRTRTVSLFAYAGFDLTGLDTEFNPVTKSNFSEVIPEMGGVLATNRNTLVPTDRFKGYLIALNGFNGGAGDRDHFTRSDFSLSTPKILWGWNADNEGGFGNDCCGLVQVTFEIPPGGKIREDFLIGQTSGKDEVIQLRNELTSEKLDDMLAEQEKIQTEKTKAFHVDLGEENKNRAGLINLFIKNGLMRYLLESIGFRDNLQNDNAGALVDVKTHTKNTLFQLTSQYPTGAIPRATRPFHRLQYSDQPAWVLLTVPGLIEESGDLSLLEEVVPYLDSNETGTVWDHMLRSMRFLASDLGKNGLCDQRYADWNDGLEATQEAGDRESVMVTMQFCYGLLQVQKMAKAIGDTAVEQEARELHALFTKRLNDVAWDGEWYVRTLCGDGYRIGSHENQDAKIFLNAQSWAIFGGVADAERSKTCMDSVEKLLKHDIGYRVCTPPFSKYDPRVGKVSNGIPGHIENGGCYCHGAAFKGVADCMLGRAEEAWGTYIRLSPDNPLNPTSQSKGEPFSFTNNYTSVEQTLGLAGYPWRTGTSGWMVVMLVEWILGARRSLNGLIIDPCLTKTIPHAKLTRTFRGARYHIELDNTAGCCKGATSITVDGQKIEGNVLPIFDGGEHRVDVVI